MQLDPNPNDGTYTFSGYGDGYVLINGQKHSGNLVLLPRQIITAWTEGNFAKLAAEDFSFLAGLGAQIVLLGSGRRQHFADPRLAAPLMAAGIALEVMTTDAACRTYNILAGERRSVACALLID